jgi:glutamine amidotransferase
VNVVIPDFGLGNLRSIQHKLQDAGVAAVISGEAREVAAADALILPGVGHFAKGMENLRASGLLPVLHRKVLEERTPILGICLGLQLMTAFSEEGGVEGLGWIPGRTVRFRPERMGAPLKIPHVGWNEVTPRAPSALLQDVNPGQAFYFTHSYHVEAADEADVLATTDYGYAFVSAVRRGHIAGVQFHPEKSHRAGMALFRRFVEMAGAAPSVKSA